MMSLVILVWLQNYAALTDAILVGVKVQRIWTGREVLLSHAYALQYHVGKARGDRGDK